MVSFVLVIGLAAAMVILLSRTTARQPSKESTYKNRVHGLSQLAVVAVVAAGVAALVAGAAGFGSLLVGTVRHFLRLFVHRKLLAELDTDACAEGPRELFRGQHLLGCDGCAVVGLGIGLHIGIGDRAFAARIDGDEDTFAGLQLHAVVFGGLFEDDVGSLFEDGLDFGGTANAACFDFLGESLVVDDVIDYCFGVDTVRT